MTPTPTTSISATLYAAADLISAPGSWTQGEMARDQFGSDVESMADDAVCFCLFGALEKISGTESASEPAQAFVIKEFESESIVDWNDAPTRTQSEVVAKLRELAALASEQSL